MYLLRSAVEQEEQEQNTISLVSMEPREDETVNQILSTIHLNHPLFRDAIKVYLDDPGIDPESGLVLLFSLFENYGDTIRYCVQKKSIPLEELIDVLFANPDYCEKYRNIPPEQFAAKLIHIRNQMPEVWNNHFRPLIFQLSDDVPHLANSLCEQFGTDDIAAFIYLNYDDAVPEAATAIDKFGDLGIYILNRYSLSNTFRHHLKNASLGVRIIPYVARFEDKGLERLDENKAWLDKYFDQEENPKEEEWWRSLPGGSAVGVAKNWAAGVPCEWGEIGWAAIDVAEATLLAVSMGAAAPASVAKSSATTTTKVGTKAISRNAISSVLKSGTRFTKQGARAALRKEQKSLIRRSMARSAGTSLRLVSRAIEDGVRWTVRTSRALTGPAKWGANNIYQTAKSINVAWKNVSPGIRRATYRSLLVTGLAITAIYRTIPMIHDRLPDLGQKIGESIAEMTQTVGKTVASTLNGYLDQLLGTPQEGEMLYVWYIYLIALFLLYAATFFQGKRIFRRKKYA